MSAPRARDVAGVYRHIIDDVVTRVRTEFVQEGVDEAVLDELRELWEAKLVDSGAIDQPASPPAPQKAGLGPAPQHYQPVQGGAICTGYPAPHAGAAASYLKQLGKPETYLQPVGFHPGASSLPPGYPAIAPAGYAQAPNAAYAHPAAGHPAASAGYTAASAAPAGYAAAASAGYAAAAPAGYAAAAPLSAGYAPLQAGAPAQQQLQQQQPVVQQQYAQQRSAAQQPQQHLQQPVQAQQQQQRQQQYQQQQQYRPQAAAAVMAPAQPLQASQPPSQQQQPGQAVPAAADSRKRPYEGADQGGPQKQPYQPANGAATPATTAAIPQRDGNDDEAGPSDEGATAGGGDDAFAGSDEGEDPLAGLSSDEDEEGANVQDVVLAQFEKVSRTKTRTGTKWKCQLKNGIMHLNGRDVIFSKCTGEMQF